MTAHLNERQVARIKALLGHARRGERAKIARFFGMSPAYIGSVAWKRTHGNVEPAQLAEETARAFFDNVPGEIRLAECVGCGGVVEYEKRPGRPPSLCPYCGFEPCEQCEKMFPVRRPSEIDERQYCSPRCKNDAQIAEDARRPSEVPDGHRWCPRCGAVKPEERFDQQRENGDGAIQYHRRCRPCRRERRDYSAEAEGRWDAKRIRRWRETGKVPLSRESRGRRARFREHLARAKRALRKYDRTCPRCVRRFTTRERGRIYCSDACCWRHNRSRRRARLRDAFVEDWELRDIYARDGGICQLCHEKVDRRCKYPHPRAPVPDHIIPISKGGTDEPKNVQLAHHRCNDFKKAGSMGSQLRMFG